MTNFSVGQMVVCVDDDWSTGWCDAVVNYPERGRIYTIRYVFIGLAPQGTEPGLLLEEVINDGPKEHGFRSSRFRPVKETSIQIFRDLVAPIKDKVRA